MFVRAPVSEILIENGRAVGVKARGVEMRAKVAVVSGAGFRNTFGSSDLNRNVAANDEKEAPAKRKPMLPEAVAAPHRQLLQGEGIGPNKTDKVGGSLAMMYLFVGLDGSDEELQIKVILHEMSAAR